MRLSMRYAHLPFALVLFGFFVLPLPAQSLPGTKPLTAKGDLAAQMVSGIDKYLDRELAASIEKRKALWKPDFSSPEAFEKSTQPNRERLARILGVVEKRMPVKELEYVSTTGTDSLVAEGDGYKVYAVRWPVLSGVEGEGLLLEPKGKPVACVVAIPDADWTPEMLVGLAKGVAKESQFARHLAENGCRVLIPTLIDRKDTYSGNPKLGRLTNQPHREFIYRMAFELGRHIIGYEVQKVLAAVDWFTKEKDHPPVGVYGYGEGGLLAFYSAALDTRIKVVCVSGYFGPREGIYQEPIYRNVWGLLREFGDAEIGTLVAPRTLLVEHHSFPKVDGPPDPGKGRGGAAPGKLRRFANKEVLAELERMQKMIPEKWRGNRRWQVSDTGLPGQMAGQFLDDLASIPVSKQKKSGQIPVDRRKNFDPEQRQKRQFDQLVAFTQHLWRDSEATRDQFWSKADASSPEKWEKSTKAQRDYFWDEVIGKLPATTLPMNVRTRLAYETPNWKGYEVVLDLYDDVICYGILLIPNDLKPGERRPVVVCQHGLEGRPQDIVNPKLKTRPYNSFGAQLADRGYVVFAPQNPYIGGNTFRQLQRKANPLKLSIYSFIVRQHERILEWLATLPFVDPTRIAYYGLSYGGKVAMRIPALLGRYCLSICSGDFNEWIWKNVTLLFRSSYMFSGEYEMYEFNLGNTFNYAEMAALIAPRPFMVERGHDDPVGLDEWVAYEYARVRRLYARLKLPERTEIEFFAGGHQINGQRTFVFLDRHLKGAKK
jgi:cephalosporin-C deacetylase-like acetyl esterase